MGSKSDLHVLVIMTPHFGSKLGQKSFKPINAKQIHKDSFP